MEQLRKPYQGVWNIVRFNWHFYLLSFISLTLISFSKYFLAANYNLFINIIIVFIIITTSISLIVSYYVYDFSGLYKLNWIQENTQKIKVANINAGFDETSTLLQQKFKNSNIYIFDFFDPIKHTEISIKRARKVYPPHPSTKKIITSFINVEGGYFDKIFLLMAAHEIRNNEERIVFFKEVNRAIKLDGSIFVLEHLRDFNNFLAYNFGFFHFLKKTTWVNTFKFSQLKIEKQEKINPFIILFELKKNGTTS